MMVSILFYRLAQQNRQYEHLTAVPQATYNQWLKWIFNASHHPMNLSDNKYFIRPSYSCKDAVIKSGQYEIPRLINPNNSSKNYFKEEDEKNQFVVKIPVYSTLKPEPFKPRVQIPEYLHGKNESTMDVIDKSLTAYENYLMLRQLKRFLNNETVGRVGYVFHPDKTSDRSDNASYDRLRSQILEYTKAKDGINKKNSSDMSFQKILDGAEDFLNLISTLSDNNSTVADLRQPKVAFVQQDSQANMLPLFQRSYSGFNETYGNDEDEESVDSPETREIVESLKNLTKDESVYRSLYPRKTKYRQTKNRFREQRLESIPEINEDFENLSNDKEVRATSESIDPMEIIEQEAIESTEASDQLEESEQEIFETPKNNKYNSKVVEKISEMDDTGLNKRIDRRICRALDLLKNALRCGENVASESNTLSESSDITSVHTYSKLSTPEQDTSQTVVGVTTEDKDTSFGEEYLSCETTHGNPTTADRRSKGGARNKQKMNFVSTPHHKGVLMKQSLNAVRRPNDGSRTGRKNDDVKSERRNTGKFTTNRYSTGFEKIFFINKSRNKTKNIKSKRKNSTIGPTADRKMLKIYSA